MPLCNWTNCTETCWFFSCHSFCLLTSCVTHMNRNSACCCGGWGSAQYVWRHGKEVSGIISSECAGIHPFLPLRPTLVMSNLCFSNDTSGSKVTDCCHPYEGVYRFVRACTWMKSSWWTNVRRLYKTQLAASSSLKTSASMGFQTETVPKITPRTMSTAITTKWQCLQCYSE